MNRRTLLVAAAGALTASPALSQEKPMSRLYAIQMAIIEAWHHQDVEGVLVHLTDDIVWHNSSGLNPAIRGKDRNAHGPAGHGQGDQDQQVAAL
jgi:limonene-1,2-epoxide hydrolase